MQIRTVASADYAENTIGTVTHNDNLNYLDGALAPATANFIGGVGGKVLMTTRKLYYGKSIYAKGEFPSEGGKKKKNVLFYSPPKFLVDVQGREWVVKGGYVNGQLPVDNPSEMKYKFDLPKIPVKLVRSYEIIHLNVTGNKLNQLQVAPQNDQPNPPVR